MHLLRILLSCLPVYLLRLIVRILGSRPHGGAHCRCYSNFVNTELVGFVVGPHSAVVCLFRVLFGQVLLVCLVILIGTLILHNANGYLGSNLCGKLVMCRLLIIIIVVVVVGVLLIWV